MDGRGLRVPTAHYWALPSNHFLTFSAFGFSLSCSLRVFRLHKFILSCLLNALPLSHCCLVSGCNKFHRKPHWKSFISTPFFLCSEWRPVVQWGSQKKQPHIQLPNAGQPSQWEPRGVARARAAAAEIRDNAVFCRFWAQVHQGGRWRYVKRGKNTLY